jgi:hypothetical protein
MKSVLHASSLAALLAACTLAACAREDSPEAQVRAVIDAAEQAAEARDVSAAMRLVADDYADSRGFDREALRRFVHGYFVLNQSIRLLVRVEDVQFPADELAQARVTIGTLGTRGEEAEDWSVVVDLHEFDVELVRDGREWLLRRAEWSTSH